MKNVSRALVIVVGLGSGAVGAAQTSQSLASTVTVTGCLQRGGANADAGTSGTPPAGQAVAGLPGFTLSNAVPSGSGAGGRSTAADAAIPGAAPTTSAGTAAATSGRGPATPPGRTYTLLEGKAGELTPHVGHQIQVTGTLVSAATGGATGTSGRGSAGSTSTGAGSTAGTANQRLQVTAIQMASPTCPSPAAAPIAPAR